MSGRGNTTYAVSGETTEWEDILIKKGITTKEDVLLAKGLNPEDVSEAHMNTVCRRAV
jgi:phosphoribosylanthranilate isomerase